MISELKKLFFITDCHREGGGKDHVFVFYRATGFRGNGDTISAHIISFVELVRVSKGISKMDLVDNVFDFTGNVSDIGNDAIGPTMFADLTSVISFNGDYGVSFNILDTRGVTSTASEEIKEPNDGSSLTGFARKDDKEE